MKKIKFASAFFIILASIIYIGGCGDNSSGPVDPGAGSAPTINMKVGSFYVFNVDSIQTNGSVTGTRLKTSHTFFSQGTYFGQSNAFAIRSETKDSVTNVIVVIDTYYVRYDAGKFYQYGILQLISPSFPATWDVVADFTVSSGSTWNIGTNVPFVLGPITGTANITGKIAVDTTFKTHGYGARDINAFRSEIVADILISGFSIGKVYVDYFVGDSDPTTNPAGLVRLRLRPIVLIGYQQAGADQKIQNFIIPPQ